MNNIPCTVIHFDYGGCYSKDGVNTQWIASENKLYPLVIKKSIEEVTYYDLVDSIYKKIMVDEATTKLILSYIPLHLDPPTPSYISNDVEVYAYFMTMNYEKHRGILHVEVVKDVEETQGGENFLREDRGSAVGVSTEVLVSSARLASRVNDDGIITLYGDEPWQHEEMVNNDEMRNSCMVEENPLAPAVEEGDDVMVYDGVNVGWEDGINVSLYQDFGTKKEVQDIVEKAAHLNCFQFTIINLDTKLYVVKCSEARNGCKWSLRAAKLKSTNCFSIRTHRKMHTCSRSTTITSQGRRKGTPSLVASILHDDYPGQFETPTPKVLIGLTKQRLGVQVSYSTALRGKHKAANDVRGSPEESYRILCSYLYMLERENHGTVTRVEVDEHKRFKYLFFALGACIEGFKALRKVIVVDGTHLKTVYGGVLIVATTQDPDHHHYPIAFGVVDGEKDASWGWFLKMLKLVVPDSPELVFLSDRNQSIIKCIGKVYPLSHHGYCMYHLSQNVKASVYGVNKDVVGSKFMECASAYTEAEFVKLYVAFRMRYPAAAAYLDRSVGEDKWSRCYFPGERYNILTTNTVEAINGILKNARKYALLPMLDVIIGKVCEWFNKHRKSSAEIVMTQKLVPHVEKIMHERCKDAKLLAVFELNSFLLEYSVVGLDGNNYLVDLRRKTCSCKCFDIDKYPCVHALAANLFNVKGDIDVHELCSKYYLVELWALAYSQTVYPVPHQNQWVVPTEIQEKNALPPIYEKKKGRIQENRFPSVGEHRGRRRGRGSRSRGQGSTETEGGTRESGGETSQSGRGLTQSGRGSS